MSLAGALVLVLLTGFGHGSGAQSTAEGDGDPLSRAPVPSAGCGASEVDPGTYRESMDLDGTARSWVLQVPSTHDGSTPVPLVFLLHGLLDSPGTIESQTGFGGYGLEEGFMVVAPAGRRPAPHWIEEEFGDGFTDVTRANPDIVFVEALLDRLEQEACIDLARVYAAGFSNGAMATSAVACTLEDRIAAVAAAGGLVDFGERCVLDRPVPYLAFHGRDDTSVLFDGGFPDWVLDYEIGGVAWRDLPMMEDPAISAPIPDRVAGIAARNGCTAEPSVETLSAGPREPVERWTWACPTGAEVELLTYAAGGHLWPTELMAGIDGTKLAWEFFEQHPMPA
jgi:polyhydroxybutyrate depolymerase